MMMCSRIGYTLECQERQWSPGMGDTHGSYLLTLWHEPSLLCSEVNMSGEAWLTGYYLVPCTFNNGFSGRVLHA